MERVLINEDYLLVEEEVLTENYRIIEGMSDVDTSKTDLNSVVENYKKFISDLELDGCECRPFKSQDQPMLLKVLKNRANIKAFLISFLASGALLATAFGLDKYLKNKRRHLSDAYAKGAIDSFNNYDDLRKDIFLSSNNEVSIKKYLDKFKNNLESEGDQDLKQQSKETLSLLLATGSSYSLGVLINNLMNKINIKYNVFSYKGISICSVYPKSKDKIVGSTFPMKTCYYLVVVKEEGTEYLIMKKIKNFIPKEI